MPHKFDTKKFNDCMTSFRDFGNEKLIASILVVQRYESRSSRNDRTSRPSGFGGSGVKEGRSLTTFLKEPRGSTFESPSLVRNELAGCAAHNSLAAIEYCYGGKRHHGWSAESQRDLVSFSQTPDRRSLSFHPLSLCGDSHRPARNAGGVRNLPGANGGACGHGLFSTGLAGSGHRPQLLCQFAPRSRRLAFLNRFFQTNYFVCVAFPAFIGSTALIRDLTERAFDTVLQPWPSKKETPGTPTSF